MGSTGKSVSGGISGSAGNTATEPNQQDTTNQALDNYMAMSTLDASTYFANLPNAKQTALTSSNGLQALTNALNMHDKPTVVDDATFDANYKTQGLDGTEMHQGLYFSTANASQLAVDQFKFGDTLYQGYGVHGNGTYFTTRKSYARSYAGYGGDTSNITAYIDKSKAKVITESDLRAMFSKESAVVKSNFRSKTGDTDDAISIYAIHKGYNVISVPNGNGNKSNGDFYVPLTRSVLVVREHTKVK